MKRTVIFLIMILIGILVLGGTKLAVAEEISIEIIGGEIEFSTNIFSMEQRKLEGWKKREMTERLLNIDQVNRDLEAKIIGRIIKDIDWELAVKEDEGIHNFSLAFARDFDNSELKLTFWDGVHNINLRGRRKIGNVEAQTVIANQDAWDYVDDQDTYIRYYLNDEFNITFKPFEADFTIGDEFEDQLTNNPGLESNYQLSEVISLSGSFWTAGESIINELGQDGWELSERYIQIKSILNYEKEDINFTLGSLLDIEREEQRSGDRRDGDLLPIEQWIPNSEQVGNIPEDAPKENFIINLWGNYKLSSNLNLKTEAKLGQGSFKNENTSREESLIDSGLYAKLTRDFADEVEAYASYMIRRTDISSSNRNDEFDLNRIAQTFNLGAEKSLGGGLNLLGDLFLTPSTIKMDGDINEEHRLFVFEIITGLRYEF